MFCTPELAARIDRAEGHLCAAIAELSSNEQSGTQKYVSPVAGGVAIYAGPNSPSNKMIGIGFDGPTDVSSLSAVEAAFAVRAANLQAEVSTLADPSLHGRLGARGYLPHGFENVLGHPLKAPLPVPAEVTVSSVSNEDYGTYVDTMIEAFANPDTGGVGGDAIPPSDDLRRWVRLSVQLPEMRIYLARLQGKIAGGAALRTDDRIAQFCGAGTRPAFRRRGVQTALLRARLADAKQLGCEIAVVVTQPASKSQQNAQREGFALLYSRQLLIKEYATAGAVSSST